MNLRKVSQGTGSNLGGVTGNLTGTGSNLRGVTGNLTGTGSNLWGVTGNLTGPSRLSVVMLAAGLAAAMLVPGCQSSGCSGDSGERGAGGAATGVQVLCQEQQQPARTQSFTTQPFSWNDDIRLGYLLADGRAGIVEDPMDLPANAFDAVRVHVKNTDTGHATPIPPTGWTWMLESALSKRPVAHLVSEQAYRVNAYSSHQARWVAGHVALRAEVAAETDPASDRAHELHEREVQVTQNLQLPEKQKEDLLQFEELDLKRRIRTHNRLKPTPDSFHLDRSFFGSNGVVLLDASCPQAQAARAWGGDHGVDTLILSASQQPHEGPPEDRAQDPKQPHRGRNEQSRNRPQQVATFFGALVKGKVLRLPAYIGHDRIIEGFDEDKWSKALSLKPIYRRILHSERIDDHTSEVDNN